MTNEHWQTLLRCAQMEHTGGVPVALIADSPWIPGYLGLDTVDYLMDTGVWWRAQQAIRADFPGVIFLPDHWVEFGMAAEPSGFGCVVHFHPNSPPTVSHLISSCDDIGLLAGLPQPNPRRDGLMALALNRYRRVSQLARQAGQPVRVVAARGPLNIASHLMGVTEFLLATQLDPDAVHKLLKKLTRLVGDWLEAQAEAVGTAEGMLLLDDLIGFFSEQDYLEFAHPYLRELTRRFDFPVKMLHNDTHNPASYPYLGALGFNIFNFTHEVPLAEARRLLGENVCLMGNVPPLEVLAQGTPGAVRAEALARLEGGGTAGLLLSAGGGLSMGTPRENIDALLAAAAQYGGGAGT